jgi:hypothetical protein
MEGVNEEREAAMNEKGRTKNERGKGGGLNEERKRRNEGGGEGLNEERKGVGGVTWGIELGWAGWN